MFKYIFSSVLIIFLFNTAQAQSLGGFLKRAVERKASQKINQKIDEIIDGKTNKDSTQIAGSSYPRTTSGGIGKLTSDAKPNPYYKFTSSIESSLSTKSRNKGKWITSKQKMYINEQMPVMGMRQYMESGPNVSKGQESFSVFDFDKDAIFNLSKFDDVKMVMAVNLGTVGNIMTTGTPNDKILHWKKIPESKEIAGYMCDRYLIELRNGVMNLFISRQEIPGFAGYVSNMQKSSKENNSGWNLLFALQKTQEVEFKRGANTKMEVTAINKDDAFEFDSSEYKK
jgi:hypothetical protein